MRANVEKKLITTTLVSLLLGLPGVAKADVTYTFTTIDVPLPPPSPPNTPSSNTQINGNSPNALVGQYESAGGPIVGFILRGDQYTTINVTNSASTSLNGINAGGQFTGTYEGQDMVFHAFFAPRAGAFTTIVPPASIRSQAGNLNASGQVVGSFRTSDQVRHGFLWNSTSNTFSMTPFNNPADNKHGVVPLNGGTVPFGINDVGQIVGDYVNATDGQRHGFLLSNGTYTNVDPPGSILTVAEGINDPGVIVGVYLDSAQNEHGFVLKNGTYTPIDVPASNGNGTEINSANPQGEIVGYYFDSDGNQHGFVGTPQ